MIPDVFEDISWSTESVFRETLSRINSVGQRIHVLPEWADIDTMRDLQKFFEKHNEKASRNLHTMNYLYNNPDLLRLLDS